MIFQYTINGITELSIKKVRIMNTRYAVFIYPFIGHIPVFSSRIKAVEYCLRTRDDISNLYPPYLNYVQVGNIISTNRHLINTPQGLTIYSATMYKQQREDGGEWRIVSRTPTPPSNNIS